MGTCCSRRSTHGDSLSFGEPAPAIGRSLRLGALRGKTLLDEAWEALKKKDEEEAIKKKML